MYRAKHITFKKAAEFVREHHRHHKPPQGAIICLGLWSGDSLVGVATLGRPVARQADNGDTVEITRLCVLPDHRNAASALLGRVRRVAQSLGYGRVLTYTLEEEPGSSLRASGATLSGTVVGRQWSCPSRPREFSQTAQNKRRWIWEQEVVPFRQSV